MTDRLGLSLSLSPPQVTNWTELEVVAVAVHPNLSTPQPVLPLHQASTNLDLWRTVVDLEVMETLG